MERSLMAIYAHPDDEAFGTGATISRYTSEGVKVYLVSATRGEVGEISDPALATPETLGCVREDELRCAAETMGVTQLIFLDYRDSGMVGTPENRDPRAFINASAEEVVPRLVSIIRSLRPEVIMTFEPNGGYGHPDHIAIHKHTMTAFHAAADPTCYPELGAAWQVKRLFYTAIPRSFFEDMRQQMIELKLDTKDLGGFDDPQLGWPDEAVNVRMDVAHSVESKWQALQCHRTQFGPGNLFRRLPEDRVKKLMSREYFALAWPEPVPGLQLPDLFSGV
jgi:N-acetyl-1-D-myo-inositol-2-amino-2-deoxy-alpha-D-glucopyranoside deacetylase